MFIVLLEFYGVPLFTTLVSVVYFRASPSSQPLRARLLASAHGAVIAAFYLGAICVGWAGKSRAALGAPFALALTIPIIFMVLAFVQFRGRRIVHLLQLVNLLCLGWTLFVGGMAVTGDWL